MRVNKHGIPGIGVTGKKGKKGKYGNSFYFGTIDSFFSYIGNNTLKDISINYDDIDYDITYAEDELRLDPKYHEGDILYILSDDCATRHTFFLPPLLPRHRLFPYLFHRISAWVRGRYPQKWT